MGGGQSVLPGCGPLWSVDGSAYVEPPLSCLHPPPAGGPACSGNSHRGTREGCFELCLHLGCSALGQGSQASSKWGTYHERGRGLRAGAAPGVKDGQEAGCLAGPSEKAHSEDAVTPQREEACSFQVGGVGVGGRNSPSPPSLAPAARSLPRATPAPISPRLLAGATPHSPKCSFALGVAPACPQGLEALALRC